jgi:hypothetical protein
MQVSTSTRASIFSGRLRGKSLEGLDFQDTNHSEHGGRLDYSHNSVSSSRTIVRELFNNKSSVSAMRTRYTWENVFSLHATTDNLPWA